MSATPGAAKVVSASLAAEGLTQAVIGGTRAIVAANPNMLFGQLYETTVTIQTPNAIGSVFGPSIQFTDFQLAGTGSSTKVDIFNQMFLEFTVSNNDGGGAALTVPPVWYAFSLIQLMIDGNSVSQYQYPQQMESMYACRAPRFDHNYDFAELGYPDATFTNTGITIADGVSRTFMLPIHYLFPELMKLPLKSVTDNVTLRFYFQPGAGYYFSTSASTTLSCTLVRILASGQQMGGPASMLLRKEADTSVLKVPIIIPQVRTLAIGALTAAASSPIVINLTGAAAQLRVWLYDTTISTPESKLTTSTFTSWQLLDASGSVVNLGSFYQYENLQWEAAHYGRYSRVLPQTVSCSVAGAASLKYIEEGPCITFCHDIGNVINNVTRHGDFSFSGNEQFQVTGTFTNGQALLLFDVLGFLRLENGHIVYEYQSR